MISSLVLENARKFAYTELSGDSGGHDWWHVKRVSRLAREIALAEGVDPDFCELAALLHDIPDDKRGISEEIGLQNLEEWMATQNLNGDEITIILEIISTMSYRGGNNPPLKSLEGKVVQDADRLDAIGAIGIARAFAYSGKKGQLLYDPELPVRQELTIDEYRNGKSTAINHFHEKLLKLPQLMNTDYARKLAVDREKFMKDYLDQFMKEWES